MTEQINFIMVWCYCLCVTVCFSFHFFVRYIKLLLAHSTFGKDKNLEKFLCEKEVNTCNLDVYNFIYILCYSNEKQTRYWQDIQISKCVHYVPVLYYFYYEITKIVLTWLQRQYWRAIYTVIYHAWMFIAMFVVRTWIFIENTNVRITELYSLSYCTAMVSRKCLLTEVCIIVTML